jgi:hypothetical protein
MGCEDGIHAIPASPGINRQFALGSYSHPILSFIRVNNLFQGYGTKN